MFYHNQYFHLQVVLNIYYNIQWSTLTFLFIFIFQISNNNQLTFSHDTLDNLITETLTNRTLLTPNQWHQLALTLLPILKQQPNLLRLEPPITIIGDIHGQFTDLLEILKLSGAPPHVNLLFLGDLGDRGYQGVECCQLTFLLLCRYPHMTSLIKGNHESRAVSQVYGLYDEVIRKYGDQQVYREISDIFDALPLAAVIGNKIFAVHGGLSPAIKVLSDIDQLQRFQELPHEGPIADLTWSDPDSRVGFGRSARGCGYTFGSSCSQEWLKKNNLSLIVRAHQVAMDGLQWWHDKMVVTVFSAPNYCFRSGNKGCVMEIDENLAYTFIQYGFAPRRGGDGVCGRRIPEYFL